MTHQNYEHYSENMIFRLDGFFGSVDARMNARIEQWITGNRVLDVGCGFGQLVEYLRLKRYQSTGVDLLEVQIATGKQRFPEADLRLSKGNLDFPDKSIDTIILKDTIHHIVDEGDVDQFFIELKRVCCQRVIIMDPNPSPILLTARKIIGHQDPVCKLQTASGILEKYGFRIIHKAYTDVIVIPLSGGYVGKQFIQQPHWSEPVLAVDEFLERFSRLVHLHQLTCWRYMLVGELAQ